jgi:hypothetical protein
MFGNLGNAGRGLQVKVSLHVQPWLQYMEKFLVCTITVAQLQYVDLVSPHSYTQEFRQQHE